MHPTDDGSTTAARRLLQGLMVAALAACAALPTGTPPPAPADAPAPLPAPAPTAPPPAQAPAHRADAGDATPGTQRGRVSHYGSDFAGKKTANGDVFDPDALTMAHRTLPFGTRVRVTNLENQRSVEVLVNDRGPAIAGRIADLSRAAAQRLGMIGDGVVEALLEVLPRRGR